MIKDEKEDVPVKQTNSENPLFTENLASNVGKQIEDGEIGQDGLVASQENHAVLKEACEKSCQVPLSPEVVSIDLGIQKETKVESEPVETDEPTELRELDKTQNINFPGEEKDENKDNL